MAAVSRCLLGDVAQGHGVLLNPLVTSHDGHQGGRLSQHFNRSKVERVEGPDRLNRKRSSGSVEHLVSDGRDVASCREASKGANHRSFLTRGQPAGDPRADPSAFERMTLVFKDGVAYDSAELFESVTGWVGVR